jgi:hypothetical protein
VIHTALALAKKGLAVFPCLPRDKRPAGGHGLNDATTERETIVRWWTADPDFNIGIATGKASGVFVVDVDGCDGELELRKLETEHGALPATIEAITGRDGGRHLYFKMPAGDVRNTASKICPGVDTRGTGGYVLAPPSIHPCGKAYAWSVDCAPTFADPPQWLLDKIAANGGNGTAPTSPSEWRVLVASPVSEGTRNNTLTRLTGLLLRRFVDPVVTLELVQGFNERRCVPPLPEDDVARIVDSICAKELRRRERGYA